MRDFIVIAITSPSALPCEAMRISRLLEEELVDFVHVRKPEWTLRRTEALIEEIPERLRNRIKIHDHFELAGKLGLGGVHLNSRNPVAPDDALSVSYSCHSIEQLDTLEHYNYVTLSPVFDSISKKGYEGRFNLADLKDVIAGRRVVALGGVTPDKFPILRDSGFYGAAMLGYFWQ